MKIDTFEVVTVANGWVLKLFCFEHNESEAFKIYVFEKSNVKELLETITDLIVEGEFK